MRNALIAILVLTCIAADTRADLSAIAGSIRMHDQVAVNDGDVTLADLAEVTGDDADELGRIVVARLDAGQSQIVIDRREVQARLSELGVNWGKVSLRGFTRCVAHRLADGQSEAGQNSEPTVMSNPNVEVTLDAALTLREKVVQAIEQLADADRADLRITFHESDEAVLSRSALEERYEIEPTTTTIGGRVPIVIRRYVGDRIAESFNVQADVAHRRLAAVAVRSVKRHDRFTDGDVEIREVFITDGRDQPITDLRGVIGQTAAALVRDGSVIYPRDVRSPVLIRRGELVTVRCFVGDMVIKTVGRAAEDGSLDQLIAVRNERSRQTFTVRVTGVREAVVKQQQPTPTQEDKEART